MRILAATLRVVAFLSRHWAAAVFMAAVALEALVFAPRHMFGAMIAAAIVATGAVIGHWWM